MRVRNLWGLVGLAGLWAASAGGEPRSFEVRPELGQVRVHLFKKGLLKGLGHEHDLEWARFGGTVKMDWQALGSATVQLRFEAASLSETNDEFDSKDRHDIEERARGEDVLDVEHNPEIRFDSLGVEVQKQEAAQAELQVRGRLTLHGTVRDVTVPVKVKLNGDVLRASGSVELKQTDFAIEPVSAALGTVKVKDEFRVDFDLGARAAGP
jgi:polyisoprenoid-binding protein YceI